MTLEQLKQFLAERPALTPYALEQEINAHNGAISKALAGIPGRNISKKTWDKLIPVLKKYGYTGD